MHTFSMPGWTIQPKNTATNLPGWSAILGTIAQAAVNTVAGFGGQSQTGSSTTVLPCYQLETQILPIDALTGKLYSLFELGEDWDGFGASPPSANAIKDALNFASNSQYLPSGASVAPSSSGSVGIYWQRGLQYATLEFEGDGTWTLAVDSGVQNPGLFQEFLIGQPFTHALAQRVNRIIQNELPLRRGN
jgi:hypothetical protein